MSRFSVGIMKRDTYVHAACFEEAAHAVSAALRALGHELADFDKPGRLIMFGVNNSIPVDGAIPDDAIVYNTEQLAAFDNPTKLMLNFERWKHHVIWDYSQTNVEALRALGATRVVHCPLGYMPSMQNIDPVKDEDIDVLFYGAVNPRRAEILEALEATDLNVKRLYGVYGKDRDDMIARSKIVLNLRFYEKGIFEIFRCSHLFANRKCVVSEEGHQDPELEAFAQRATAYVSRDKIVDRCLTLVSRHELRDVQAARGFLEFSETSMVDNVRKALEAS